MNMFLSDLLLAAGCAIDLGAERLYFMTELGELLLLRVTRQRKRRILGLDCIWAVAILSACKRFSFSLRQWMMARPGSIEGLESRSRHGMVKI